MCPARWAPYEPKLGVAAGTRVGPTTTEEFSIRHQRRWENHESNINGPVVVGVSKSSKIFAPMSGATANAEGDRNRSQFVPSRRCYPHLFNVESVPQRTPAEWAEAYKQRNSPRKESGVDLPDESEPGLSDEANQSSRMKPLVGNSVRELFAPVDHLTTGMNVVDPAGEESTKSVKRVRGSAHRSNFSLAWSQDGGHADDPKSVARLLEQAAVDVLKQDRGVLMGLGSDPWVSGNENSAQREGYRRRFGNSS